MIMDSKKSKNAQNIRVAALYQFAPFGDPENIIKNLRHHCSDLGIKGILLVAHEGINGTISGRKKSIDEIVKIIRTLPGCRDIEVKYAWAEEMPFWRMKIRLKKEIVTMGRQEVDPRKTVGKYVAPKEWNALLKDPDTCVIDTRNDYEVAIGTFEGAIDPDIKTFRAFPQWFENWYQDKVNQGKKPKVAMFCTGGIRCEKATSFAREYGLDDIYHLKGGILKYLETVPKQESMWNGECFVFDQRVSVGHGLKEGDYQLCHACRHPLSADALNSPYYEEGVYCPHCYSEQDTKRRRRHQERERQMEIAAKRGEKHLGMSIAHARREKRKHRKEMLLHQKECAQRHAHHHSN